jgi:hypothetical protein
VEANSSTYTGERILSQNSEKSLIVHLLLGKVKELRNMNSGRTRLLARRCHECRVRLLKTPLPCFNNFGAAIGDGDDKFMGILCIDSSH